MENKIREALEAKKRGQLVVIPTETVYGLSAPIDDLEALKKIFELKERPFFDPLIVHVCNISEAHKLTRNFPKAAEVLAQKFMPGPLTLVLPKASHVPDLITSGLPTVGIRIPNNELTLKYIETLGTPVAAPSANKFGKTSPTCKEHVLGEFDSDAIFILDDGPCEIGIESTIVKIENENEINEVTILRPGIISMEDIQNTLLNMSEKFIFKMGTTLIEAPGTLKHHYAPKIPLRYYNSLNDYSALPNESELKLSKDVYLAARELYAKMRELSVSGAESLYFIEQDYQRNNDSWAGILDRLKRASF